MVADGTLPWHQQPIAVIDFETTGFHPAAGDRVIEVGVVTFDAGEVSERWGTLVDPEREVPPRVTEITHIHPDDLRGQPKFGDVAAAMLQRLQGRILVAYNAPFDRNFLIYELNRCGLTMPRGARWLDPLVLATALQKGQGRFNLGAVAKRLAVPLEEAHRATADAECAGWVLQKLAAQLPPGLDELLDLQERWEGEQQLEQAWRVRKGRDGGEQVARDPNQPIHALGPAYPFGRELDPVRYMYLRGR